MPGSDIVGGCANNGWPIGIAVPWGRGRIPWKPG